MKGRCLRIYYGKTSIYGVKIRRLTICTPWSSSIFIKFWPTISTKFKCRSSCKGKLRESLNLWLFNFTKQMLTSWCKRARLKKPCLIKLKRLWMRSASLTCTTLFNRNFAHRLSLVGKLIQMVQLSKLVVLFQDLCSLWSKISRRKWN